MDAPDPHIARLRSDIETQIGRKIRTPKDFDFLSACISERMYQTISTSTLKRLWNYVSSDAKPRLSTLDILAQFVGSKDWEDYTKNTDALVPSNSDTTSEVTEDEGIRATRTHRHWWLLLPIAAIIIVCLWLFYPSFSLGEEEAHIIHKGQTFAHYDDIHRLFSIQVRDNAPWYQSVPHVDGLFMWAPQHKNPIWHNEGDSALLYPTITEYWLPDNMKDDPKSQQLIQHMNNTGYFFARRMNDVRITFMQNLTDSGFVFLGVYRFSLTESNPSHIVYERVADDCDLNRLEELIQLRN